LLGAAVVDDILAIAVFSAFVAIEGGGNGGILGLSWIMVRMLLFLVGSFLPGRWLLLRMAGWVERLPISEAVMSFVIVRVLAVTLISY
jgi:Kef-type K+ transport system membrane component KefB